MNWDNSVASDSSVYWDCNVDCHNSAHCYVDWYNVYPNERLAENCSRLGQQCRGWQKCRDESIGGKSRRKV